tara:strand:+ start:53 stop:985 length:933 start_codon:yes stop_codon:yes gene_type:complete
MPHKDWYWERFETNVVQGDLDLNQRQTSALSETKVEGRQDYTDVQRSQYETRFIDQLYGTDQRAWEGEKGPTYNDVRKNYQADIRTMGTGRGGKGGNWEDKSQVTWGLDLVRDWTGKENLKVGTDEHYKWQTTGKVDWAHYYNDNAYQAAWKEYKDENKIKTHGTLEQYLTADYGKKKTSDQARVDFVSWADKEYKETSETEGDWWKTWDNKYVDQFDPDKAEPYKATYLDVPDLWGQADFETVLEPMEVTPPAGLPSLSDIQRTQVNVPDSLQSWGEAKSAPTNSFKPGGGGSSGGGSPPPPTTQGGKD